MSEQHNSKAREMPSYLSSGSKHYNQARRIQPHDPVGQLSYYLERTNQPATPLSSSTSSSSSAVSSTRQQPPSVGESQSDQDYSTSLANILAHKRGKHGEAVAADGSNTGKRTKRPKLVFLNNEEYAMAPTISESPQESSGFSVGTQIEASELFVDKTALHQLQESNWLAYKQGNFIPNQQPQHYGNKSAKLLSADRNNRHGHISSRVKRRNISRHNRRLVLGGSGGHDHLVNPYALSELFSQSEIPGFREIFASDSYLRKFCWVIAFLFMTVLSLNDMTELITEYYEYPITVDVRLRDSARLPFPSVTVCNLNVVRFSALCSSATNSRFDLANQIPSELRDKLCGLQVEKKNSSHDTDIGDINNIGITTTTTATTTYSASTTSAKVTVDGTTGGTTSLDNSLASSSNGLNNEFATTAAGELGKATTLRGRFGSDATLSGEGSTVTASTTLRHTTTNGGLDLGDFVNPSLLVIGKGQKQRHQDQKHHIYKRSIKLSDPQEPRPFASSHPRLRISTTTSRATLSPLRNPMRKQQVAAGLASSGNRNSGIRQPGSPGGMNAVTFAQNPLIPNLATAPTLSPTTPMTPLASSTPSNVAGNFVPPALSDEFELTERQERELQENLTNWLAVMWQRDPQLTWSLGHQFDDMILRCTMKAMNCTHRRSFENSFTPTEGNCFNYKSKARRRPTGSGSQHPSKGQSLYEEANLAGTVNGLELVLNLEKNEYVSGSSQVGALVMIHHPSDLGYAASEATFVAPEFTTYIGLKMVNITRLPAPYPEYCVDSWPAKFADTLTRNSTYSQQACLKICVQKTIQSHCQCQSAFLPIVELDAPATDTATATANNSSDRSTSAGANEKQPQRIIICDTRKSNTRQCVKEVTVRAVDRVHNCECPPKCQVVRYDKTISMARWPTREDKVTFDRGKMDVNFQNLAKVIVYFQTMTCEEVTQQAVFNAAKLFSALGGIMGMYVGFSFLSVFEIFEVISRKTWHHFRVKIGQQRPTPNWQARWAAT